MDQRKREDRATLVRRKLESKYPDFFPIHADAAKMAIQVRTQLEAANFLNGILVCCQEDVWKLVFLAGLGYVEEFLDIFTMNAYELVNMSFPANEDLPRLQDIATNDVIAIWFTGTEKKHATVPSALCHLMDLRHAEGPIRSRHVEGLSSRRGKSVWLFYRGTKESFQLRYRDIYDKVMDYKYSVVSLQLGSAPTECEAVEDF